MNIKPFTVLILTIIALAALSCQTGRHTIQAYPTDYRFDKSELEGAPCKGSGKITIVEFSDFQCFFCMMSQSTLRRILEEYSGKVRICWKYMPIRFHKYAHMAATAACIVHLRTKSDEKFWDYHDLLFASQMEWASLPELEVRNKFAEFAEMEGLNKNEFLKELANPPEVCQKRIENDVALARKAGVKGTPTFFISGTKIVGAQKFERFKAVIDSKLAHQK